MSKCKAANSSSLPGLFELQKYCDAGGNFKVCRLFQLLAGGKKMPPMTRSLVRNM
ncbi:MAG: hypothetical protein M0Z60_02175 [Nitrospiraceae bacterium]|nr:hypothetical protein [Nitrospiraceae bacterium]